MSHVLLCQGTALALPLRDASVHVCVTSPPYWGLRDYQTGTWQGGDPACDHIVFGGGPPESSSLEGAKQRGRADVTRSRCRRCGATRVDAQLGLEATPDAYIAAMVQVFREVHRVLRPEGTCWVNMGDSYASGEVGRHDGITRSLPGMSRKFAGATRQQTVLHTRLPAKNLLGMPWRLALALQADGWILRSDIIWDKPSCMPESVQDRPTRSHEYVFLFSKQAHYHYDVHAIREPGEYGRSSRGDGLYARARLADPRDDRQTPPTSNGVSDPSAGRNARTVWRIPSEPFSGHHYAAFPQALVRRCLLAGAPTQVCAKCGAPWKREVERICTTPGVTGGATPYDALRPDGMTLRTGGFGNGSITTTGFTPTCACQHASMPCTILDPFCGSGTTLLVARELGHHAVGIDLSYPYLHDIARERLGLAQLAAWNGTSAPLAPAVRYDDLPLFGG